MLDRILAAVSLVLALLLVVGTWHYAKAGWLPFAAAGLVVVPLARIILGR